MVFFDICVAFVSDHKESVIGNIFICLPDIDMPELISMTETILIQHKDLSNISFLTKNSGVRGSHAPLG